MRYSQPSQKLQRQWSHREYSGKSLHREDENITEHHFGHVAPLAKWAALVVEQVEWGLFTLFYMWARQRIARCLTCSTNLPLLALSWPWKSSMERKSNLDNVNLSNQQPSQDQRPHLLLPRPELSSQGCISSSAFWMSHRWTCLKTPAETKQKQAPFFPPPLLPTYNSGSERWLHLALVQQLPVQLFEVGVPQDRALTTQCCAAQPHAGVLRHELQNKKGCLFPPARQGQGRKTY